MLAFESHVPQDFTIFVGPWAHAGQERGALEATRLARPLHRSANDDRTAAPGWLVMVSRREQAA